MGSSPRLRGTLMDRVYVNGVAGIIPALAGNICRIWVRRARTRDHPRACGEHVAILTKSTYFPGSSPRLRGTLQHGSRTTTQHGIIPALAGNIRIRWCVVGVFAGSSPRLRGTYGGHPVRRIRPGIIPALAGNIVVEGTGLWLRWDHPRACGEHATRRSRFSVLEGSSPRLRGT